MDDPLPESTNALDARFFGTWTLVGVSREEVATGVQLDVGVRQSGYITYTPEGRVTRDHRPRTTP